MNSYSLLLINRPREDEKLSWPCWLTYIGRLTHKVIIRPASSQAQDRESSQVKDQRSTTVLRHQLTKVFNTEREDGVLGNKSSDVAERWHWFNVGLPQRRAEETELADVVR